MNKVTHQRLQPKMMTGSKKEKANTGCVSTTITLNAGTMNMILLYVVLRLRIRGSYNPT
jgi:hypothetical protein